MIIDYGLPEDDFAQLADAAKEQLSEREIIWLCPYCINEVGHEPTKGCCGEIGHEIAIDRETWELIDDNE
jgi:hypothetical protein